MVDVCSWEMTRLRGDSYITYCTYLSLKPKMQFNVIIIYEIMRFTSSIALKKKLLSGLTEDVQ